MVATSMIGHALMGTILAALAKTAVLEPSQNAVILLARAHPTAWTNTGCVARSHSRTVSASTTALPLQDYVLRTVVLALVTPTVRKGQCRKPRLRHTRYSFYRYTCLQLFLYYRRRLSVHRRTTPRMSVQVSVSPSRVAASVQLSAVQRYQ